MPPPYVKTIKQLIFYQCAKISSESAGFGKDNYKFITDRWKKYCSGENDLSSTVRELEKERKQGEVCLYCNQTIKLTKDHMLPVSCGGEDIFDNVVWVCGSCNSKKNKRRLYEWRGLDNKDNHHRIAEGKYLKYLYALHERRGTLDLHKDELSTLCSACDLEKRCKEESTVGKLSVFCIEGCFKNT